MTLLDLLLVVFAVGAAATGYRLGLAARAVSWLGALAGLALSVPIVPVVLGWFDGGTPAARLLVGLAVVLLITSVVSGLGEAVGVRLGRRVRATSFGPLDRAAGGIAGATSVLLVLWLLLPAAANTPGPIAQQVRRSTVVDWVESIAPPPPGPSRALGRLVDRSGFPEVFADLGPAPETGPPPSQIPVDPATVARARRSTVNVEAFGCGAGAEGSGFVVAPNLVVTNAHVVAGATDVRLRRPDGTVVDATVRHTDDDRDLALLAADIGRPPLSLRAPQPGEPAAVIGYPGGQNTPRVAAATITGDRRAVGRDVYGDDVVERRVLVLAADLQQGDSGSAVVARDGAAVGVVFAVSPDDPTTAYALHVEELRRALEAPPNATSGACL